MGKIIDITDKLSFEGNPMLVIRGEQLEVNADAPTVLKAMNLIQSDGDQLEQVNKAYELIFTEKARKVITDMKLSIPDWMTVVQLAVQLIVGEENSQGEH